MNSKLIAKGNRYYIHQENKYQHEICSRKEIPYVSGNQTTDAVSIIARHKTDNNYAIIRQFRPTIGKWIYEFPAGKVDNGEEVFTAARRELKEETGLLVSANKEDIFICDSFPSVGITDEKRAIVYCTCYGEVATKYQEKSEIIEPMLLSIHDLEDLVEEPSNEFDTLVIGFILGSKYGCFL